MFEYFKALNKKDEETVADFPAVSLNLDASKTLNVAQSALNNPITKDEINLAIKSLKLNKSSGIDEIVNEYIISTEHLLMPIYEKLFNTILDNGTVPSDWTKGNIIPIFKNKCNKNDPANYRHY